MDYSEKQQSVISPNLTADKKIWQSQNYFPDLKNVKILHGALPCHSLMTIMTKTHKLYFENCLGDCNLTKKVSQERTLDRKTWGSPKQRPILQSTYSSRFITSWLLISLSISFAAYMFLSIASEIKFVNSKLNKMELFVQEQQCDLFK